MSAKPAKGTGVFLVLDGPDGCGKSTQAARLVANLQSSTRMVISVREPGGTQFGEALRAVLLSEFLSRSPVAEVLGFFAARAQLLDEVIVPSLEQDAVVVCDRFVSSTYAYQTALSNSVRSLITSLEKAVVRRPPDLLIILDMDPVAALARVAHAHDGIESRGAAFHARVREGFLAFARSRPYARVVDASGDADAVAARVLAEVQRVVS